jgi:hypothetical protein
MSKSPASVHLRLAALITSSWALFACAADSGLGKADDGVNSNEGGSSPVGAGGQAQGECTPGSTFACTCPGGQDSHQACSAVGQWGECNCENAGVWIQSLPCDVKSIIDEKCSECHGPLQQFGALMPLVSWNDFDAPAVSDGSRKVSSLVPERIHHPTSRMPPAPYDPLSADELAVIDAWIAQGAGPAAVSDACYTPPPVSGTGGAPGAGGSPSTGGGPSTGGSGGIVPSPDAPADCQEFFEFRAHGAQVENDTTPYVVPNNLEKGGNQYTCFYFDPPYADGSQALFFKGILDDTRVLHHWLLYGTDAKAHPSGTSGPCSAAQPGSYLIAGWAPGATDVELPPNVGLDLPSGPNGGLILEVHYYNAQGHDAHDRSGVQVCTAPPNTREHTAAVHFLGSEGICIPPYSEQIVTGQCAPQQDQGDIHIINVWPHMHQFGTRMETVINRAGGPQEVLHDEPFDFNSQINYPKDVVIKPGDTLTTRCHYQNTTGDPVPFGDKTQDEMCYNFVMAWPAGALGPNAFEAALNPVYWIQPARRCMNPVSILDSCNGLADYPTP